MNPLNAVRDLARGLAAVSPVSFVLGLRAPRALPAFHADVLRAYRNHAGRRLPAIVARRLLGYEGEVTLRLGVNGVYAAEEGHFLIVQIAAMLRPMRTFEIGTYRGFHASLVAMNTPDDAVVFTLDLPPQETLPEDVSDRHLIDVSRRELGVLFRGSPYDGTKIRQLLGDSAAFDFSPYYDSIDFIMVDGSHTFAYARSDSLAAFRMIRPGGVIIWHDYESMRSEYGVSRVVDGLRYRHGCPTYRLSTPGGDTRWAVLRVDGGIKHKLMSIAEAGGPF